MTADVSDPTTHRSAPHEDQRSWVRGAGWLTLAVVVLSASNYAFSLLMARVLPGSEFVVFVGAQSVLLVIGTGVMAAIPWVVSREVARYRSDPGAADVLAPGQSLWFALAASAVQGLLVAGVAAIVCLRFGSTTVVLTAAFAAFALSLVAAPVGFLQGSHRFATISLLRLGEGVARIGLGLLVVVAVSASAWGALLGMPVGSLLLVAAGLVLCRSAAPLRRPPLATLTRLLAGAAVLGAGQLLLTAIASIDTVIAAGAGFSTADGFAYQTAALLGRAPLFVALALSQALYPVLVRARSEADHRRELGRATGLYLQVGALVVLGATTVPVGLLGVIAGDDAADVADLVRITAVSGVLVGLVSIVCVARQARGLRTSTLVTLGVAAVGQAVVLHLVSTRGGPHAFAVAGLATLLALTAVLLLLSRDQWPYVGQPRRFLLTLAALAAAALPLQLITWPPAWVGALAAVAALVALSARRPHPSEGTPHEH